MLSEMAHWYTVGVDGRSGGAPRGLVWTRPQCRAGWRTVGLAPLRSYISNFELHLRELLSLSRTQSRSTTAQWALDVLSVTQACPSASVAGSATAPGEP